MPPHFQRHAKVSDYDKRRPRVAPRSYILPPAHGPHDQTRWGFVIALAVVLAIAFLILFL